MVSVTKALALTSSSTTLVNANTHTLEIEEGKPPEHYQQVVRKSKKLPSDYDTGVKRARYRTNYERNLLGLLRYNYSEWEDQVISESTAQAWEFHVSAASSGWRTHLKQYVVVSKSSPVYKYAEDGNIVELKKLFSQGLATPFSLSEQGSTLLHIVSSTQTLRLHHPNNHYAGRRGQEK
ncbi:hypothetical protein B0H65DRAFT_437737 [Neurospora tetraspora]|uniref:Uncharacterized protein n=1 Tax=Neurospora tetraspora TaxID=94610 RepID=A0AAE0JN44_9PEZI|nr:hypothetical protein B0H65DRAFT_437737 [Neurospora tetraspora]